MHAMLIEVGTGLGSVLLNCCCEIGHADARASVFDSLQPLPLFIQLSDRLEKLFRCGLHRLSVLRICVSSVSVKSSRMGTGASLSRYSCTICSGAGRLAVRLIVMPSI